MKGHTSPLKAIGRDDLAPIWARADISTDKIGAAMGVSGAAIRWKAKALGLPPRGRSRAHLKKSSDDLFIKMWEAGVSTNDIARHLGYSHRGAVSRRREMMGLCPRVRSKGTNTHAGWPTISLVKFLEIEMAARMQANGK